MGENWLTPATLRAVLDAWCEAQPGVIQVDEYYEWFAVITFPPCYDPANVQAHSDGGTDKLLVFEGVGENFMLHDEYSLLALTLLAIEHHYVPWLKLVATLPYTLPYTGAQAAREVLDAWGDESETEGKGRNVRGWGDE